MSSDESIAGHITRLVQHVALNESGWWDQAVQQLVLACAYTLSSSSRDDIVALMVESCGVQPHSERVKSTIQDLIESGELIENDDLLRVSEVAREALRKQETDILNSEDRVRNRFAELALEHGLGDRTDELWSVFETEVVLPVVRHMGARMYGLLTADRSDGSNDLESRMNDFLERHGDQVRTFIAHFLDPRDDDVRGFVLLRLNAQYAVDAAALPDDALERLSHLNNKPGRVDMFLDTIFLFSVLGLHDNPSDDVANELLHLVQELKGRVDLRLYVLPETIDEARKVLRDNIFRLQDFHGQRNLAEAARKTTSLGLARCYFEAARKAPHALTAEVFFGPYESDPVTVLRSKGVELYNQDLSHLHTNQDVIDDIHDQAEIQERVRARGPKPYEANLHDMVLWHFTRSRRSSVVESPLEATVWIATLDYGLIGFDRQKQKGDSAPPICLEPSSLIQLFQFWIPSSTKLDEALVGSVRQPLLFLTFDKPSEQVTLRILSEISRYEGIGDLNSDVVSKVLTNRALRIRLTGTENDRSDDQEIVREGIVDTLRKLSDEVTGLRKMRSELEEQVAGAKQAMEAQRTDAKETIDRETDERNRVQQENQQLTDTTAALRSRVTDLESKNEELTQNQSHRKAELRENWRFAILATATVILSITALIVATMLRDRWASPLPTVFIGVAVALLALPGGLEFAANGTRYSDSGVIKFVSRVRSWWWIFILGVAGSVVADLLV